MALLKKIELNNGVIVNYHRIVSINKITNNCNIIEIASYPNEKQRQKELVAIQKGKETGEAVTMNIFIDTTFISKEYLENETITDTYEYLKTIEKFNGAEDI